ncbi:MAG: phage shock protein PspC (stress-responsive transcriptional regulator) [Lentimonas sp.]|jgi:phage shock protein PspC (stress-responsive transcriptional regulator)
MKKTISIHIKGINFLIEEDAYELLQTYLTRLENKLSNLEGKSEIVEDIELRIAELFTELTVGNKEVIELGDVQSVTAKLGEPEDYIDEDDELNETVKEENSNSRSSRKFYRDLDRAAIAGVCSGLSNYLNIDIIVVRLVFLISLLFGGFGFPLYVLLWIIIPAASTHIDRLKMKGRPITVENVKDEVSAAAQRMANSSQKVSNKMNRDVQIQKRFASLGRLIAAAAGIFVMCMGVFATICFVVIFLGNVGFMPITGDNGLLSLHELGNLILVNADQQTQIWWISGILATIIIFWLLATGTKMIFNLKFLWYKVLTRVFVFALIAGTVCGFYYGTFTAKEFTMESEIERKLGDFDEEIEIEIMKYKESADKEFKIHQKNPLWLSIENGVATQKGVSIVYRDSPDSLFHVYEEITARGATHKEALRRAKNINYTAQINGNKLTLPYSIQFPSKDKIRDQHLKLIVQIPLGRSIRVNNRIINLDAEYEEREIRVKQRNHEDGYIDYDGDYIHYD